MSMLVGIFALTLANTAGDDPLLDRQFALVQKDQRKIGSALISNTGDSGQQTHTVADSVVTGFPLQQDVAVEVPILREIPVVQSRTQATAPRTAGMSWSAASNSLKKLPELAKKVSINMENKSASDVLKWMSKQGVNFVVNVDSLPKNKVSLNMKDAPLSEILVNLADVLGGNWDVRETTLIFRPGRSGRYSEFVPAVPGYRFAPEGLPPIAEGKALGQIAPLSGMIVPGQKFNEKMFAPLRGFGEARVLEFQAETFEKMAKQLDEKKFGFDQARAKILELHAKAMELHAKEMEKMKVNLKEHSKVMEKAKARIADVKKLLSSLTKEQKDLMKSRGHLLMTDLTKDQIKLLNLEQGHANNEDFVMNFVIDGEKIVIKGK